MEEPIDVNALHGLTVETVKPRLAELNKDQLEQLRALETAEGEAKARDTLVKAIDARLKALADDDLQAALAAERERVAQEDAALQEAAAQQARDVEVAIENAARLYLEAANATTRPLAETVLASGAELYFSAGESFLPGMPAVEIAGTAMRVDGGRLVVDAPVDFPPIAPTARIEAVWLRSRDDWAMTRLMQPLVIGGGHEARLPAGHLAFAVN